MVTPESLKSWIEYLVILESWRQQCYRFCKLESSIRPHFLSTHNPNDFERISKGTDNDPNLVLYIGGSFLSRQYTNSMISHQTFLIIHIVIGSGAIDALFRNF